MLPEGGGTQTSPLGPIRGPAEATAPAQSGLTRAAAAETCLSVIEAGYESYV